MPAPVRAAAIGPAATIGPMPGMASGATASSSPPRPPSAAPAPAPASAPEAALPPSASFKPCEVGIACFSFAMKPMSSRRMPADTRSRTTAWASSRFSIMPTTVFAIFALLGVGTASLNRYLFRPQRHLLAVPGLHLTPAQPDLFLEHPLPLHRDDFLVYRHYEHIAFFARRRRRFDHAVDRDVLDIDLVVQHRLVDHFDTLAHEFAHAHRAALDAALRDLLFFLRYRNDLRLIACGHRRLRSKGDARARCRCAPPLARFLRCRVDV